MRSCENFRFIEKHRPYRDLTFKFYSDGTLAIIDNDGGGTVTPRELKGDSHDFYVRRRIAFIKNNLLAQKLKHA
ncbi:hypothetical protein PA598K_04317 [Paenibacillus sp. 598K]|jgi:hypothetical protein|uniref:hypothetical protein n=1 Tax=Paenibacillus sp. 598K TaxID=1117987 RepID=UPI000FFA1B06|nr:hypothetical protein [Paenibacillus sp. 598K]GBF75883.1 hypothetical protein PA598K_04317 [Paenibacillus sp. 598K]